MDIVYPHTWTKSSFAHKDREETERKKEVLNKLHLKITHPNKVAYTSGWVAELQCMRVFAFTVYMFISSVHIEG